MRLSRNGWSGVWESGCLAFTGEVKGEPSDGPSMPVLIVGAGVSSRYAFRIGLLRPLVPLDGASGGEGNRTRGRRGGVLGGSAMVAGFDCAGFGQFGCFFTLITSARAKGMRRLRTRGTEGRARHLCRLW